MKEQQEKPIIMSTEMIRATLEDRKTMTRRTWGLKKINQNPNDWMLVAVFQDGLARFCKRDDSQELMIKCPYGGYSDKLWVKEKYLVMVPSLVSEGAVRVKYSDDIILERMAGDELWKARRLATGGVWKSSLFMPRWASRILLEIKEIRAERLQEITQQDVIAEGIPRYTFARGCASTNPPDPRWKFIELWDSLNKARGYSWHSNPWCWPISFQKT